MKPIIITANIGGIDEIKPIPDQSVEAEFTCFKKSVWPLPIFDNRMKGKAIKTQLPFIVKNDTVIWIDGSVEITSPLFIDWVQSELKDCDLILTKHAERNTIKEEFDFILEHMDDGNKYLLSRYKDQPFDAEMEYYDFKGFDFSHQLVNGFFFAYQKRSETIMKFFNMWFKLIIAYTNFDQSQLTFLTWLFRNELKIKIVDSEGYFIRHKHAHESSHSDTL